MALQIVLFLVTVAAATFCVMFLKAQTKLLEQARRGNSEMVELEKSASIALADLKNAQLRLDSREKELISQASTRETELRTLFTGRETELRALFAQRENELKTQFDNREKELKEQLKTQFENLANKIFDEKTKTFNESSEKNMHTMLSPLKEQLNGFQKKVEEVYQTEARERHTLKSEIEKLLQANTRIGEEAKLLTQALTGQSKTQGDWGEIQLQRLLESAGLVEGSNFDFVTQARDMGLKQEETGNAAQPDVIIKLPDKKHVIIDSKVSLTHYYMFTKAQTDGEREGALKSHLESVYAHISELSAKDYSKLEGLTSPELVMLFMPTEGALTLAIHSDAELFAWAWKKNVILVGPTNLFAVLKTVSSIWTRDRQKENALEIARQSGSLLDKLYAFVEDLEKVGESLGRADRSYQAAMNKLKTGRGNILNRADTIRKLGARAQKGLSDKLSLQVEFDDDLSTDELAVDPEKEI